jgi:hypothetical protein
MDMVERASRPLRSDRPSRYPSHLATGANMSLLIENCKLKIENCAEIGVFTDEGLCVGTATIPNQSSIFNLQSSIGIAVWGDDLTTPEKDGADENDALSFRLWDGKSEHALPVHLVEGQQSFKADGIAVFASEAALPETPVLVDAYPNPFNSMTTIRYSLPELTNVKMAVYDLNGREVATLLEGPVPAGAHTLTWAADKIGAGVYFLKYSVGDQTTVRKLLVVK